MIEVDLVESLLDYNEGKLSGEGLAREFIDKVNYMGFKNDVFCGELEFNGRDYDIEVLKEIALDFMEETYTKITLKGLYDARNEYACLNVKNYLDEERRDIKHVDVVENLTLCHRYIHQKLFDLFSCVLDSF